jgi:hypothetical protein
MSQIYVQDHFALEHQILHTDVNCISENKMTFIIQQAQTLVQTSSTEFKHVDPIVVGLVNMQA